MWLNPFSHTQPTKVVMNYFLIDPPYKKKFCCDRHDWRLKFQQGTNDLFVVCILCNHAERVSWQNDYQKQVVLEELFK